MKRTFIKEYEDIEQRIRKAQRKEIIEMLWERYDMIKKVLQNGHSILEQAYGKRFEVMYEKRKKLYSKLSIILSLVDEIRKMH